MADSEQHPDDRVLIQALDGELAPASAPGVNAHLAECEDCRSRREDIAATLDEATDTIHRRHLRRVPQSRFDLPGWNRRTGTDDEGPAA